MNKKYRKKEEKMKARNVFVTFMLVSVVLALLVGVSGATWCDAGSAKRTNVSVNNTAGSALINYQVYVNLTSNPINETSLRVYNTTDCTLRPHWTENETDGNSYGVWINYSAVAASSWTNDTAIYYDNATASSANHGTNTFEFFDDFEGTSLDTIPTSGDATVSAIANKYEAWGGIAKDSSGNFYAVYRTSDSNIHGFDSTGRFVIRKSTDDGQTWGSEITIADIANLDDRTINGILIFDDAGTETILAAWNTYKDSPHERTLYIKKSTDGGSTWGSAIEICPSCSFGGIAGKPILTSQNKILVPAFINKSISWQVAVFESSDGGDNWTKYNMSGADSARNEMALMETKTGGSYTGGIYAVFEKDAGGAFDKKTSTDYGHTWSAFSEETQLPVTVATQPNLHKLSNGNIIAAYTDSHTAKNLVVYESSDECVTWTYRITVITGASIEYYPSFETISSSKLIVLWCVNGATSDQYVNFIDYPFTCPKWNLHTGSVTVSNSILSLDSNPTYLVSARKVFIQPMILSGKMKFNDDNQEQHFWGTVDNNGAVSNNSVGFLKYSLMRKHVSNNSVATNQNDAHVGLGSYRNYEMWWKTDEAKFYEGENLTATLTTNVPTVDLYILLRRSGTSAFNIDRVLVRKYASPEPSTTLGSEEQPAETTPVISNVQNGSISATSQYVNWTVNQTAHNRVLYSNESDLTPAYYSTWDNSTAAPNITLSALDASTQYWYQAWSYNTTNNSLTDNSSTLSFTIAADATPALHIDNSINIKEDWGRDFNSNLSANVTVANASGVWMNFSNGEFTNIFLGWVNLTLNEWVNETHNVNSPVTNISVDVTLNSTTSDATNDTESFYYEITNRSNTATMDSAVTQNVEMSETFYVNATCNEEYSDTFLGAANLLEDGAIIDTDNSVTDYVNFSHSESVAGQYNYTIRFYNLTHYNNATTPTYSNVTVTEPTYIPPDPTNLQNTSGNYWVNYTWDPGTPGNVTDLYNVSWNDTWYNDTSVTYMNDSIGAGNWANITVYAYNSSGTGTLSSGSVSDEVKVSDAPPEDYIPPDPTGLANSTGNFWVNHTWSMGTPGNITDSYNVSWNLTWYNTTLVAYMNDIVGEFGWGNITVWAYNTSGSGSLSAGNVSDDTQAEGGTFTTFMGTTVYNLITYYGSSNSTAEQFGANIGSVDYIAKYNGSFYTHTMGFSANNFTTVHGIGYYVYLNASGSTTYSRNNISDSSYNTQLYNRWNTIGWTNATDTNAEGVASLIGSACKYTSSLNADGITYTTHTVGFTSNNHGVEKGEGYWIWVNTGVSWGRNS